jgi:hypothetical protein
MSAVREKRMFSALHPVGGQCASGGPTLEESRSKNCGQQKVSVI